MYRWNISSFNEASTDECVCGLQPDIRQLAEVSGGAAQNPSAEKRFHYLLMPTGALPGTAGTHPEPRGSAHSPPVAEAEISGKLWLSVRTQSQRATGDFTLSLPCSDGLLHERRTQNLHQNGASYLGYGS